MQAAETAALTEENVYRRQPRAHPATATAGVTPNAGSSPDSGPASAFSHAFVDAEEREEEASPAMAVAARGRRAAKAGVSPNMEIARAAHLQEVEGSPDSRPASAFSHAFVDAEEREEEASPAMAVAARGRRAAKAGVSPNMEIARAAHLQATQGYDGGPSGLLAEDAFPWNPSPLSLRRAEDAASDREEADAMPGEMGGEAAAELLARAQHATLEVTRKRTCCEKWGHDARDNQICVSGLTT
jgi:hypothetical protein